MIGTRIKTARQARGLTQAQVGNALGILPQHVQAWEAGPNGRRAWRKWMRRVEHDPNLRPQGKSISRLAREGKRHLGSIPPTPAKPFTARSLVGMTMGARKRKRWDTVQSAGQYDAPGAARYIGGPYRIGERLRPCPGCQMCGPIKFQGDTKIRSQRVVPWRKQYPGMCDGSGVLPARRS